MIPQDSAKFWFPKLARYNSLRGWLPNTVLIDYNEELLAPSWMGKTSKEYERLYYAVEAAIRYEIAGPAFIRTDLTSAKHKGRYSFIVEKPEEDLNTALLNTLYHAELKSYHSKVKSSAIMVRSLLSLAHRRTAFNGLPIAKEWRAFSDGTSVQCIHPYWPKEALEGHMDDGQPPSAPSLDWSDYWVPYELPEIAKEAARVMGGGKWSIDFAEDTDGKIWLLDMATAGNSYHAECEFKELDKPNVL